MAFEIPSDIAILDHGRPNGEIQGKHDAEKVRKREQMAQKLFGV